MARKLAVRRTRLKQLSNERGIYSDAKLARLMDISTGQLNKVLLGKSEPGTQFFTGLMDVFGADLLGSFFVIKDDTNDETGAA